MNRIQSITASLHRRKKRENVKPESFQKKLFINFAITGFIIAIAAAFAYSYIASNMIAKFYEREGLQATEHFAQLSELALIYESGENAKEAALATLNYPSVKHVAVISDSNIVLLDKGETTEEILSSLEKNDWQNKTAKIFSSGQTTWQIAAPVFTSYNEDDSSFGLNNEGIEEIYLGYVALQIDTSELRDFQLLLFIRNLGLGLGYGLVFASLLILTLRRLLKPMNKLTKVMEQTSDGIYKISDIDDNASKEIIKVAEVYNQMISNLAERDQKLRSQKNLLKTEVALRTSELVQARDAALEANQHKTEFLANVTHELRTPLQSIIGYSEVVKELMLDEGVMNTQKDLDKITHNADHLLSLINSILDISKIEAGKMELNNQHININELLKTVADTIAPLIEKNNNQLIIDAESIQQDIYIDQKKLFQVLLNLLSNAAKFTQQGSIQLLAKIDRNALTIDVIDSGIGISPEQQAIIFEPFRQIDGSETRKFVGTGLGLSIAMHFAQLIGGTISLTSQVGEGSCFQLALPITQQLPITSAAN
tara:strand:+ start:3997 stop:5616 length:1620 start_codon:yes stop_codon:yes gene_type:complete